MMHIFSHFCFWFFSIFLYLALRPVDIAMGTILAVVGAVSLLAIYFFMKGYKNGMAVRTLKLLQHIPFIKEVNAMIKIQAGKLTSVVRIFNMKYTSRHPIIRAMNSRLNEA